MAFEALGNDPRQLVRVHGLGQEVVGPGLEGGHGRVDVAISGQQHHPEVGRAGQSPGQEIEAGQARHAQVGHEHGVGVPFEGGQGLVAGQGMVEGGAGQFRGEQAGQTPGEIGLVVDDEHARGVSHGASPGIRRGRRAGSR